MFGAHSARIQRSCLDLHMKSFPFVSLTRFSFTVLSLVLFLLHSFSISCYLSLAFISLPSTFSALVVRFKNFHFVLRVAHRSSYRNNRSFLLLTEENRRLDVIIWIVNTIINSLVGASWWNGIMHALFWYSMCCKMLKWNSNAWKKCQHFDGIAEVVVRASANTFWLVKKKAVGARYVEHRQTILNDEFGDMCYAVSWQPFFPSSMPMKNLPLIRFEFVQRFLHFVSYFLFIQFFTLPFCHAYPSAVNTAHILASHAMLPDEHRIICVFFDCI